MQVYDNFNDKYYDLIYDYYNDFYYINQVQLPKALHLPNPIPEQLNLADVIKGAPDEFFWRPMRSGNMDKNQDIFMNYIFRYSFRN